MKIKLLLLFLLIPSIAFAVTANKIPVSAVTTTGSGQSPSLKDGDITDIPATSISFSVPMNVTNTITATQFVGGGAGLTGITSSQWTGTTGNPIYYQQNVGIGSTAPGSQLDVQGTLRITGLGNILVGAPGFTDTGVLGQYTSTIAGYNQVIDQNLSSANNASSNFIVSNNLGTSTTYYGELGMNSSTFVGSGAWNLPNDVYLDASTADLSLGTLANSPIHFFTNSNTTDAMDIVGQNVGIGSVNPTQALDVGGTVNAKGYTSAGSLTGNTNYISANVGIGKNNPSYSLDVNGTVSLTGLKYGTSSTSGYVLTASDTLGDITLQAATGGSGLWTTINTNDVYEVNSGTYGNVGIGTTLTTQAQLRLLKNSTTDYVHIDSTAGGAGNVLDVSNSGNVGIGSSTPGSQLDVFGTARILGNGNLGIGVAAPGQVLDAAGTARVTGQFISTSALNTNFTTNVGINSLTPGQWLDVQGTARFLSGNVGIGTQTTSYGLDVLGTTRINGDIVSLGASPACSSCGSCSVIGNDNWFRVTVGSTTTCTATFSHAKSQNNGCICSQEGVSVFPVCSVSTTAVTCSTVTTSDALDCSCGS